MRFKLKNMAACRISFLSVFLFSVPFMYMWFNWCIFDYKRSKNSCCLFYVVVWYIFRRKKVFPQYTICTQLVVLCNNLYGNRSDVNIHKLQNIKPIYETILQRILSLEVSISILNRFWMFSISFCRDLD